MKASTATTDEANEFLGKVSEKPLNIDWHTVALCGALLQLGMLSWFFFADMTLKQLLENEPRFKAFMLVAVIMTFLGSAIALSNRGELRQVKVCVRDLFGCSWTTTVHVNGAGTLVAPSHEEERVLSPIRKELIDDLTPGFPSYQRIEIDGVPHGVKMLGKIYKLPVTEARKVPGFNSGPKYV